MRHRDVLITAGDHRRLRSLLTGPRAPAGGRRGRRSYLRQRVRGARVVTTAEIPRNVVTMNSRVVLRDLDSGDRLTCTLAYPGETVASRQRVPVDGPLGAALLGKRVGQIVRWPAGARDRRLRIQQVLYQPEAAGDLHL